MSSVETMSHWPQRIVNTAGLQARYIQALEHYAGKSGVDNMYCVLSPLYEVLWFVHGGQLICIDKDEMHFFSPKSSGMEYCLIKKSNVNYLRYKSVLLSSEIQFSIFQDGETKLLKTEYNSVQEELYDPVKSFVLGQARDNTDIIKERDEKFAYLKDMNFKLMNYSMQAYNYSASLRHFYQPPIKKNVKGIIKWFTKKITDGILYVLTEDELTVLEDIEHGTLYHYIRKDAITDIGFNTGEDEWGKFTVVLRGDKLSFPFTKENYDAVKALVEGI